MRCNGGIGKERESERHFRAVHRSYERDFPAKTLLRATKVRDLKAQLAARQSIFTKPVHQTQSKAATIASYRVSHVLAKHNKPFKDGDIVKETFLKAVDNLFDHFKNKTEIVDAIKRVQLSRNTATRRCEGMAVDVEEQLRKDTDACECFSVLTWRRMMLSTQTCCFTRMLGG